MGLSKKDFDINNINCDDYTQADFADFQSDDLFGVREYFSKFLEDATKKKYMVYGNPIMTAPRGEFEVFDRYTNSVRKFYNFCSYNYLGYSVHPEVIKTVQDAVAEFGTGAVSAPLLSGYYSKTKQLEEEIAKFKHKEAGMVFSTGYGTNLGVLSCLVKPGDVAVLDVLAHASIYDGVRLGGGDIKVFTHNSVRHLEKILKGLKTKRVMVCVEGVYSMDGDLAPLPEIVDVCKKYGAKILLDEAHSTLIFGENGRGVAEYLGVEDKIDLTIGTFSKSFGSIGGFVVGERQLITYMKMFSHPYVFSCAMAPYTAAGLLKILELYQKDKSPREQLWKNAHYMQEQLKAVGFDIGDTSSQVIPVMCGTDMRLREISKRIHSKGLYTGFVTYPAVSSKRTRLRLSVMAYHTKDQMDACVSILREVFEEMKEWDIQNKEK
jgi:8-amino-7-oxononanoate synthase